MTKIVDFDKLNQKFDFLICLLIILCILIYKFDIFLSKYLWIIWPLILVNFYFNCFY